MSQHNDSDLDRATTRAWRRFRSALADHIVDMGDDDILIVDAESPLGEDAEGAAPYVQFCGWGEDLVRAEVSSNHYLDARVALDREAETALVDLGWTAPTHAPHQPADSGSANFFVSAGRREADRLAAMTVAALRDVFGVPHPAFLGWPGADVVADADGRPEDGDQADGANPWRDEPLAVLPESPDQLRRLIEAALTVPGGVPIEYDDDGDIPLPTGSGLLYVRVHENAPVVEVFAVVAVDVKDKARAAFELGVLNRDNRLVKFVLLENFVVATVHVPAMPFAPRHLRTVIGVMAKTADEVGGDLVVRVDGRRPGEAEAEAEVEVDDDEVEGELDWDEVPEVEDDDVATEEETAVDEDDPTTSRPRRSRRPRARRRPSHRPRGPRQEPLLDDAPMRRERTGEDVLFDSDPDA